MLNQFKNYKLKITSLKITSKKDSISIEQKQFCWFNRVFINGGNVEDNSSSNTALNNI